MRARSSTPDAAESATAARIVGLCLLIAVVIWGFAAIGVYTVFHDLIIWIVREASGLIR